MNKKALFKLVSFTSMMALAACSSHDLTEAAPEVSEKSSSSIDFDDLLDNEEVSSSQKPSGKSSSSAKNSISEDDDNDEGNEATSSSSKEPEVQSSSSKKQIVMEDDDDDDVEFPPRSSSSVLPQSSSSAISIVVPVIPSGGVCSTPVSDNIQVALSLANEDAADMIEAAYKGHLSDFQIYSEQAKTRYGKILALYPDNCNAQFGYAISTLANLYNDEEINNAVESYKYYLPDNITDLRGRYLQDAVIRTLNGVSDDANKSFTLQAQDIIATKAMPAIDSAIAYMQHILSDEDYTLVMNVNDVTREFDKSEFAPILGALFALKATTTIIASVNLEASKNLSYDWIKTVRDIETGYPYLSYSQTNAVNTLLNLIHVESPFSTIKEEWITEWFKVPRYIDSALTEAKAGFEYGIEESYIAGSQENDIYVVGNGYDADISRSEMQDVIDEIEKAQSAINGPYELEIHGTSVVVNIKRLFRITDGFHQYLPFYDYTDASDLSTFYFTDNRGYRTASFESFLNGPYSTPDDADGRIFFPDPSFGGVFPNFVTQTDVWDFLKSL